MSMPVIAPLPLKTYHNHPYLFICNKALDEK